jgi:hypothetical protein
MAEFKFLDEERQAGETYSHSDTLQPWINTAAANWMSYLSDDTLLRSISIPGTHDSAALHGGLAVQANSLSITAQLKAGVRFLDIRTRRTKDALAIHHGAFFQHQMFGNVLEDVIAFLAQQPKEVIIMRVKADEHGPEKNSQDFTTIWASYMARYGHIFATSTNANARLKDVRGRIFLLANSFTDSAHGISYHDAIFDTQDLYKVYWLAGDGINWEDEKAHLPGKKKVVNQYLDKANSSDKWVRNYLSGSTGMAPSDVARAVNGSAYKHIGINWGRRNMGLVIMDFPGEKLLYRIIKSNFASVKEYPAKTFRCESQHSWVEFRLPAGKEGQIIEIRAGAYNHFASSKCNRVRWSNLSFYCSNSGWQHTSGNWDADGMCHGSAGNSPYVFVGNR